MAPRNLHIPISPPWQNIYYHSRVVKRGHFQGLPAREASLPSPRCGSPRHRFCPVPHARPNPHLCTPSGWIHTSIGSAYLGSHSARSSASAWHKCRIPFGLFLLTRYTPYPCLPLGWVLYEGHAESGLAARPAWGQQGLPASSGPRGLWACCLSGCVAAPPGGSTRGRMCGMWEGPQCSPASPGPVFCLQQPCLPRPRLLALLLPPG